MIVERDSYCGAECQPFSRTADDREREGGKEGKGERDAKIMKKKCGSESFPLSQAVLGDSVMPASSGQRQTGPSWGLEQWGSGMTTALSQDKPV